MICEDWCEEERGDEGERRRKILSYLFVADVHGNRPSLSPLIRLLGISNQDPEGSATLQSDQR